MRLLHVHDFFAPGNSRYGFELDIHLRALGHEVHVMAGVGERGPADGEVVRGIPFHTYPYGFGLSAYAMYRRALRANEERFGRLQAEHRFDLVLFNQPLCAAGVLRARSARGVAKAYSFISPWAEEWTIAHPGTRGLRRWIHAGFRNRLEDRALHAVDVIMVVSEFMRGRLRERHPAVRDEKLHLVPGAVDLERFRPDGAAEVSRRIWEIPPKIPVLITMRRLVPRMGVDSLIQAMPGVWNRHPEAILIVGGDGPMRAELEGLARPLGDRIRFVGYIPDDRLPAFYRAADLFVLPTRALEGFGLVALEAMACGTPVVGTPVGAIPEVLGPEFLLRGTDPESIAEGIADFLDSPRREGLRERAARYAWPEVARRAESVLRGALR